MTAVTTTPTPAPAVSAALGALFDPANRHDPYTPLRTLRAAGGLHRTPLGLHLVTRHADATEILRSPAWSHADEAAHLHPSVPADDAAAEMPTSFLWMDPPDHTRLRALVSGAFTPRLVTGMQARIDRLVSDLVDTAVREREFDFVGRIAYPLPLTIVCELVGIPAQDHAEVQRWSQDLSRGFDPDFLMTPEAHAARSAAARDFMAYLRDLIDHRADRPADDLLTALGRVEQEGDTLTELELLSTCLTTVVAGHETTVNLVSGGMLALLRNPAEFARLRERPELVPSAVEEMLRYDPPAQMTTRTALRPQTVCGQEIDTGEGVVVLINSCNRDEDVYADAERFDVGRFHDRTVPPAPRHLTFSRGIHYCLGARLAQLEMETLLHHMIDRFDDVELLADPPPYKPNLLIRGPAAMPVRLR